MVFVRLVFTAGRARSGFRCTAEHEGNTTLPEVLPHASPDQLPPRLAPGLRCPHWLERGHLNWDWPHYVHSVQTSEIVSACTKVRRPNNAGARTRACKTAVIDGPLVQSVRMPKRPFFPWVLPAVLGLLAGFLALAWAVPNESAAPVWVVLLVSPGLKIAELVMPATHESLAWTFGWFLRIAIVGNALFYFAIFALLAYLVDRRRSGTS